MSFTSTAGQIGRKEEEKMSMTIKSIQVKSRKPGKLPHTRRVKKYNK